MIQKFEEFVKNKFEPEIEQTIALSSLLQEIKHPFKNCETDYKLREWLKSNDYITNFEEFSINTEIGHLHRQGNIQYDEIDTTIIKNRY